MKTIKAFATNDGRTFTNEEDALAHEYYLECTGVIQNSTFIRNNPKQQSFTLAEMAKIVSGVAPVIGQVSTKFNCRMRGFRARQASKM